MQSLKWFSLVLLFSPQIFLMQNAVFGQGIIRDLGGVEVLPIWIVCALIAASVAWVVRNRSAWSLIWLWFASLGLSPLVFPLALYMLMTAWCLVWSAFWLDVMGSGLEHPCIFICVNR